MGTEALRRAGGVFEDDHLIDRLNQALQGLWSRLESLPAEDKFWIGTNHRATRSKLDRFAQRCLAQDPSDDVARWALVALSMHAGVFSGLRLVASQIATRADAVHDLIAVAEWVWLEVGVDPGHELEQALREVDRGVLDRLASQPPGARPSRAATAALAFLDGTSFAEAIGRQRWEKFLHALLPVWKDSIDLAVVSAARLQAHQERIAVARARLERDATAAADAVSAAHWWQAYRDIDVTDQLRDLLGAVHRPDLERLAHDQADEAASPLRAALRVLDGHPLSPS